MKLNKLYIILIILLIFTSSCKNFSEGLTGQKRSKGSDEFLVHKKKPLVLPPDFEDMPVPNPMDKKNEEGLSIEDLLNLNKENSKKTNSQSSQDKTLEKSILEKISTN